MKTLSFYKQSTLVLCFALSLLASCKKDLSNVISVNTSKTKDGFPNQPFNWETATVMMPTVAPGPLNPSLPWTSQSGSYIDASIISDYKSSDGWVLVYNTFNPSYYTTNASSGGLYFALYNVYRGLLRYYLYIPAGQFGGGVNIQHGLSLYTGTGATSKILNFDGWDIVDASASNSSFTKTNNVGIAQQGGWYAMQYEIAYDPAFSSAVFPNLGIAWNSRTINISALNINGSSVGTLTGDITQQGNSGTGSTILNGVVAAAEIVGVAVSGGSSTLNALQSAASGGLAGNLTNFFSGIFGGNSNNSQEVDLKMNASYSLSGTITTPNYLAPNTFVFPGESIASGNGSYPPLYNSLLGVFNLSSRPTVNVHTTTSTVNVNDGGIIIPETQYLNIYTVNSSVFNSLFISNPAVAPYIQNKKTQVVLLNPSTIDKFQPVGNREVIGNYVAYTSFSAVSTQYTLEHGSQPVNNLAAVRVSFDVVPSNGAPKSTIVKTFLANIVSN